MVQRRSVIFGILFGLIVLTIGLFFIFGKDVLWTIYQGIFYLFGLHPERTQGWEWLTTGLGILTALFGGLIIWMVLLVRKNAAN